MYGENISQLVSIYALWHSTVSVILTVDDTEHTCTVIFMLSVSPVVHPQYQFISIFREENDVLRPAFTFIMLVTLSWCIFSILA